MDLPPDVMRGKNAMVHEVIDGHTMRVSINSFFQSRTDGAATLARLVREATGPDKVIADLYCGVGLFAVTADRPKRIVAVERRPFRGRRREAQPEGLRRPRRPLPTSASGTGNKVDVVVADPSRAGLGKDGAARRARVRPRTGRARLVRRGRARAATSALLDGADYKLTSVTLVDLFAHTPHIECVTVLDR